MWTYPVALTCSFIRGVGSASATDPYEDITQDISILPQLGSQSGDLDGRPVLDQAAQPDISLECDCSLDLKPDPIPDNDRSETLFYEDY